MTIRQSRGFTVIEISFVIVFFAIASIIFFIQKNNLEVSIRDNTRKTAINAMYYSLEEVYFATNKYYPTTISSDNLKSVDPTLFTDPSGKKINTSGSEYTYVPADCQNNMCKSYTLKATLENESDFIKESQN